METHPKPSLHGIFILYCRTYCCFKATKNQKFSFFTTPGIIHAQLHDGARKIFFSWKQSSWHILPLFVNLLLSFKCFKLAGINFFITAINTDGVLWGSLAISLNGLIFLDRWGAGGISFNKHLILVVSLREYNTWARALYKDSPKKYSLAEFWLMQIYANVFWALATALAASQAS